MQKVEPLAAILIPHKLMLAACCFRHISKLCRTIGLCASMQRMLPPQMPSDVVRLGKGGG